MEKTIKYYNENAATFVEGTVNADVSDLYELFQKYVKPGTTILDLGCGSGRDTKYFRENGYSVVAVDGSEEMCKIAAKYTGQAVNCMLFSEIEFENQFDGIWACSSLLHVAKDDLADVFNRIYKALKHSGYLYASFKYGDFSGDRNGRFFTDLNESGLSEILHEAAGFTVLETIITGDVREGRSNEKWLNVILQKV